MTLAVKVDFSGNGDFSGGNDDITDRVIDIRTFRGLDDVYGRIAGETVITITLRNNDRRFSPENSGGIYYGALRSGLRVAFMYDSTYLDTAFTAQFAPSTGLYSGGKTCTLTCKGVKWYYERVDSIVPMYQNINAYTAVQNYVAEIAMITPIEIDPDTWRLGTTEHGELETFKIGDIDDLVSVETAQETLTVVGHNVTRDEFGRANAYELFSDIVMRESGWMYPDNTGLLTFKNRYSWTQDNTLDVTWDNDFNEPPVYVTPLNDVVNVIKVQGSEVDASVGDASTAIYESVNGFTLAPGQRAEFYASAIQDGRKRSAASIVKPAGGDFVISQGSAEVTTLGTSGQDFGVLVEAGSAGATIDTLIVRGNFVDEKKFTVFASNEESIDSLDGQRNMETLDVKLLDDQLEAVQYANHELTIRGDTNGRIESVGKVYTTSELSDSTDVIQYDIGTLVRVVEDQTGHDGRYRVVGIERAFETDGQILTTKWMLLPSPHQHWFTIESSELDGTDKLGY